MTEIVTATVSSDGPLQGAELRIEVLRDWAEVYVHLDAIGTHAAQWVALTDVDRILSDLAYEDDQTRQVHGPGGGGGAYPIWSADDDPLAEVARSHDDRAVARTERRH